MSNYQIATEYEEIKLKAEQKKESSGAGYVPQMPMEDIVPNRYQPRSKWNAEKLMELSDSIRENGVIEPLIVTKGKNGKYEIIAGERRFRASKIAGLSNVPVIIKEATPQQMLELAVVENIQRADLNPLEEARAFDQLAKEFNLTHDQIAQKVGYSRPAVANKVRLLQLPEQLKEGILEDKISEGHARAILGLKSQTAMVGLYTKIVREKLSVRATEELVRKLNIGNNRLKPKKDDLNKKNLHEYKERLDQLFGVREFKVKQVGKKFKIELSFTSEEDLDKFILNRK